MTGLSLARVSNRRRGHWSRNRGCCIDAGSDPSRPPTQPTIEQDHEHQRDSRPRSAVSRRLRTGAPQRRGPPARDVCAALRYLFDRSVPLAQEQSGTGTSRPDFKPPARWTQIRPCCSPGREMTACGDEQVEPHGAELRYGNAVSDVPFAAIRWWDHAHDAGDACAAVATVHRPRWHRCRCPSAPRRAIGVCLLHVVRRLAHAAGTCDTSPAARCGVASAARMLDVPMPRGTGGGAAWHRPLRWRSRQQDVIDKTVEAFIRGSDDRELSIMRTLRAEGCVQ